MASPILSSLFLAQPHPTRIYHHRVCTRQKSRGTRPLKDPTEFEKKNNPRSLNVSPFSVFHRGEKGFRIRRVKRAGCMFSAANQTPTAGVENGNKDQIPLHSMIGLNDGFT